MELLKKLAFGCLVLCFALQFGGCFLSSSDDGNSSAVNSSKTQQNNTEVPDTERNSLNANISRIKEDITELSKKREDAARKILDIQDKKIEIGSKSIANAETACSDKNKKETSPCQDFLDSKNKLASKNQILEAEQDKLKSLPIKPANQPTANASPTASPSGFGILGEGGMWDIILLLVGGIAGLAILGGLGWLVYSMISNSFKQERADTVQGFRLAEKNSQQLNQKIGELEKTIKLQSGQFTQIQTTIQSLERRISELSGQKYQPQPIINQPVQKPEPQFPVMAEDYRLKVSYKAQTATADVIGGLLVQDADKINEFLIVKDNELPDGLFYAVPNQGRFNNKGEYLNYFQNYYVFDNPSSGAILIKSPTVVRRVDNGWKLEEKGELEIR